MSAVVSSPPEMVVKNRFLGFLIWQSIPSTAIFLFSKTFLSSLSPKPSPLTATITFLTFHLSHLLFSASLFLVSSPRPLRPAHPLRLFIAFLRLLVSGEPGSPEFRRRARVSLGFFLFVLAAAASGLVASASVCVVGPLGESDDGLVGRVGFRGFVMGLLYGLHYVYNRRWVLEFPIIQRPPFFSFKMGLPPATTRALKLSGAAYLLSTALMVLLPDQFASHVTVGKFIAEQVLFYLGSFAVFLSWELSHHLHWVGSPST